MAPLVILIANISNRYKLYIIFKSYNYVIVENHEFFNFIDEETEYTSL